MLQKLLSVICLTMLDAQRVTIFSWTFHSNNDGWEVGDTEDNSEIVTNDNCPSSTNCFKLGANDDIYISGVVASGYHSINLTWSMYSVTSKVELWIDWDEQRARVYGSRGGIEHFDVLLFDVEPKSIFDIDFYAQQDSIWINDVELTGIMIIPTMNPTGMPTFNPTFNPTLGPTASPTMIPTFNPTSIPTFSPTKIVTANLTLFPTFNPTAVPFIDTTTPPTTLSTVKSLATNTLINDAVLTHTTQDNNTNTVSGNDFIVLYIAGSVTSLCVLCLCVLLIWKWRTQKTWHPEPHDTNPGPDAPTLKGSFLSDVEMNSMNSLDGERSIEGQYVVNESIKNNDQSEQQQTNIVMGEQQQTGYL